MMNPAAIGPTSRVRLKALDVSASAFVISFRGTRLGTIAWRTGWLNAHVSPESIVNANTIQSWMTSRNSSTAMQADSAMKMT